MKLQGVLGRYLSAIYGKTMAPTTITEINFYPTYTTDSSNCELKHREKDYVDKPALRIDPYDAVLRNDPKFLRPMRRLEKRIGFVTPIQWMNTLFITIFHLLTVYFAVDMMFFRPEYEYTKWPTVLFAVLLGLFAGFGVTAGAHRYWCHRSYKAKLPLQIILALCFSLAGQNTIYDWVRDHRVHHKFSETDADPHNVKRGFFFSHVGWLMMKKHPEVLKQGAKIDMSDIKFDPVVKLHTKYFLPLKIALAWVIPTMIPVYMWGEIWMNSMVSQVFLRYICSLNFTWSVNSFAHLWGNRPYDKNIMPAENISVSIFAMGEGWHNYHHTFPWDYKTSELGTHINITTHLLHLFARIGWAYDFKQASPALIRAVINRREQQQPQNQTSEKTLE